MICRGSSRRSPSRRWCGRFILSASFRYAAKRRSGIIPAERVWISTLPRYAQAENDRNQVLEPRVLEGAASRPFHDGDGMPQDSVDIEMGGIENVGIRRRLERRHRAFGITFVAAQDIREDRGLVCNLAETAHLDGATLRPHLGRGGYENLGVRKRTDDGADVAAVQNRAERGGGKILLQPQQRCPHLWNCRDDGSGLAGRMAFERGFVELGRIEGLRRSDRSRDIIELVARVKHRLRHRAIEQPGIEMPQPVMGCEALPKGSLAGRRRTVDGDDHSRSPPSPRMRSAKPGKLVAMKAASSTLTGLSAARPSTSAAMAMR